MDDNMEEERQIEDIDGLMERCDFKYNVLKKKKIFCEIYSYFLYIRLPLYVCSFSTKLIFHRNCIPSIKEYPLLLSYK